MVVRELPDLEHTLKTHLFNITVVPLWRNIFCTELLYDECKCPPPVILLWLLRRDGTFLSAHQELP